MVVSTDVSRSGQLGDRAKLYVREVTYSAVEAAFAAVGVGPRDRQQEDRGDGILAVLRPWVPPARVVGPWVERLYEGLRAANERIPQPVRMRVGMHVGPVADDGRGLVGRAVDLACRLCDSEALKLTLAVAGRYNLVLAVSDYLYRTTVSHGGEAIEPDHYLPVRVVAKETAEIAWVRVPRLSVPPVPAQLRADPAAGAEGPPAGPPGEPAGRGDRRRAGAPSYHVDTHGGEMYVFDGSEIHDGHFGRSYAQPPAGRGGDDRPGGEG